jgi:hypothetical protein
MIYFIVIVNLGRRPSLARIFKRVLVHDFMIANMDIRNKAVGKGVISIDTV